MIDQQNWESKSTLVLKAGVTGNYVKNFLEMLKSFLELKLELEYPAPSNILAVLYHYIYEIMSPEICYSYKK